MTCMQNFSPDLNIQSNLRPNIEIISQEIEYDEDRVFEEGGISIILKISQIQT